MIKPRRESKKYRGPPDVTVYDFANSKVVNNRLKKPSTSVTYVVKKELEVKDNWDDDDDNETESTVNNNGNIRRRKKQQNAVREQPSEDGNDYPFDVWFIISNYIAPEDVGRFAAICKTSLEVVLSVQFWIALYKRYYKKECLPETYQPNCLLRYFGLRTSVIKALYLMYPPFIARTYQIGTGGITHPDILKGKKCVGLSFRKQGKKFCYYFKFKLNNSVPFYRNEMKQQNIIELLNDIQANPDEDNCILKVTCEERIAIPPIVGQTLIYVSLTLSRGFCHHRLQLTFSSKIEFFSSRNGTIDGDVVIDPVSKIMILNWWHPLYITDKTIPYLGTE
ncbi:hypothetical protein HHI36_000750 [Cryptolaemus montrouzieri]|uniref:Transmembrane protein 183 n=1 Tax=Cryptolaemus montrouzieri TaxID=559131 RepID=A0ABD2P5Z2_9CUCU